MRTLLLTALTAALPLTNAPGQRAGERTPAERIVELTGFDSVGFDAARAAFKPVLEEFRAEGYDPKVLREIESAADAFFHKVMSDPALKTGAAKLYQETFSNDELEELLLFYQTPLGRKALAQLPGILQHSMTLGQQIAEKHAPAFQDQLTDILAKANAQPGPGPEAPAPAEKTTPPAGQPRQPIPPTKK